MREECVQTQEMDEDDLDLDLTDRVDKETQTPPFNATPFQLNRTDAMVQTDYRYFPLASNRRFKGPTPCLETKMYRDMEMQTERTTSSVSTQTEELLLRETVSRPMSPTRAVSSLRISDGPQITPYNNSRCSSSAGSRTRRTASVESSTPTDVSSYAAAALFKAGVTSASNPSLNGLPSNHLGYMNAVTAPLFAPENNFAAPQAKKGLSVWDTLAPLYLSELMPVVRAGQKFFRRKKKMVDVSVQTDINDAPGEASEYAPRSPQCRRRELLNDVDLDELDNQADSAPDEVSRNLDELVAYLCLSDYNSLQKMRVIFRWIAVNIRYDWKFIEKAQTPEEVLKSKAGVSKDFVNLLASMCEKAHIKCQKITGFARSKDFRVGRRFDPERDVLHNWAAVYIFDSWRLIDPTYGAGYMDAQGRFHAVVQEHFFLTDPDVFIYTHFPYKADEPAYYRWQLMDVSVTVDLFNNLPVVTPDFWQYGLRLRKPKTSPVIFAQQTEIQLASSTYIRYKFKYFAADQAEIELANQWVFCTIKEGGAVVSFVVSPPSTAPHVLRILAKPEDSVETDDTPLDHVASFLLLCTKPRKYISPWPLHDGAWGPTPRLYQCGLDLVNEQGPVLVSWGGKKHLTFEKAFDVLLMFQLSDKDGNSVELKNNVFKKMENEFEIHVSIVPPSTGFYKFMIYGIPRPQARGRWRLPLLATYLIESKMNASLYDDSLQSKKKKDRIKIKVRAR